MNYQQLRRLALRAQMRREIRDLLAEAAPLLGVEHIRLRDLPGGKNGMAEICGDEIWLDIGWLLRVFELYGEDAVAFVVLHELGHVGDCNNGIDVWERELLADYVAGGLLWELGGNLDGAARFLGVIGWCSDCTTHPPVETRLAYLKAGFYRAMAA